MFSSTVEINGSSRSGKCFQTDPVNHDGVMYLGTPARVDIKKPKKPEMPLCSDPYFNSAKSFPKGFLGITFDPVNKEQVFYTEYSTHDGKINCENPTLPKNVNDRVEEDSTADSDYSLDTDDSDVEDSGNIKRKHLSINKRILKEIRSLRKQSLEQQRQTLDYIDSMYTDKRKSNEREDREIQLLEMILNNFRKE